MFFCLVFLSLVCQCICHLVLDICILISVYKLGFLGIRIRIFMVLYFLDMWTKIYARWSHVLELLISVAICRSCRGWDGHRETMVGRKVGIFFDNAMTVLLLISERIMSSCASRIHPTHPFFAFHSGNVSQEKNMITFGHCLNQPPPPFPLRQLGPLFSHVKSNVCVFDGIKYHWWEWWLNDDYDGDNGDFECKSNKFYKLMVAGGSLKSCWQ